MGRASIRLAVAILVSLLLPAAAGAQTGGGLYEPFAEPVPDEVVRDFIENLPGGGAPSPSESDLDHGRFLPAGAPARASSAATVRATDTGWTGGLGLWLLAAACLTAFVVVPVTRLRRA